MRLEDLKEKPKKTTAKKSAPKKKAEPKKTTAKKRGRPKKSKQMDEIEFIDYIKSKVSDREKQIQEIFMSGGLKDMEHYKYLQGELNALYFVLDEISNRSKKI